MRPRRACTTAALARALAVPLLLGLIAGCARGTGESSSDRPRSAPDRRIQCPPPLAWAEGERRPRGVLVENETAERILVFIDSCRRHDRIGEVRASGRRLYRLPDRLVELGGGLRFHIFLLDSFDFHSATTVPFDTATILSLRVAPRPPVECEPLVFVDGERFEGRVSDLRGGAILDVSVREFEDPDRCKEYHFRTRK